MAAFTVLAPPFLAAPRYAFGDENAAPRVTWRDAGPGLAVAETPARATGLFPPNVVVVRADLTRYDVGLVPAADYNRVRSDVRTLVRDAKADAGINASFFDGEGKALGLLMSRGIVRSRMHEGGRVLTGVLQHTGRGLSVVSRDGFTMSGVRDAVQAGPRLLVAGARASGLSDRTYARRSAVCLDRGRHVYLFCVDSGLFGVSLTELQDVLLAPGIGCIDALNLDGGGSSQLYVAAGEGRRERWVEGADEVPVVLALFRKTP